MMTYDGQSVVQAMDKQSIINKFGAHYRASEITFRMGIDNRFATISRADSKRKSCWRLAREAGSRP